MQRLIDVSSLAVLLFAPLAAPQDPYAPVRESMVQQHIEARGVREPRVLLAMRATPRHLFVPLGLRAMAYRDHPLPIGYEATISQPYIVALMSELLQVAKTHRVLEIGTGSGYQAAILSQLAERVYTMEIVPQLAESARETLRRLGYKNVIVRAGDGFAGWPEEAPFDRILLTAAPVEVPSKLIDQLAPRGRMVAPVGPAGRQELVLITRSSSGKIERQPAGAVAFVPMKPGSIRR